jgi:hypothetical protein
MGTERHEIVMTFVFKRLLFFAIIMLGGNVD